MDIKKNYQELLSKISLISSEWGRPDKPELLAVSKKQTVSKIRELYDLGHRYFGESYFNELLEKVEELRDLDIRWSYIGPIQSKKIKKIVMVCQEIQTIAEPKHLTLLAEALSKQGIQSIDIFIQVNLGNEPQKSGCQPDDLPKLSQLADTLAGINLKGIMVIPPRDISLGSDPERSEVFFKQARALANGIGAGKLSLGMSNDMELAIKFGSDCLRVGTALFGAREKPL